MFCNITFKDLPFSPAKWRPRLQPPGVFTASHLLGSATQHASHAEFLQTQLTGRPLGIVFVRVQGGKERAIYLGEGQDGLQIWLIGWSLVTPDVAQQLSASVQRHIDGLREFGRGPCISRAIGRYEPPTHSVMCFVNCRKTGGVP